MSAPLEFIPSTACTTPKTAKKVPFSSSEKELLVALVRERPIIEDKRTNAKNIDLKRQAWEELTVAFNAQAYVTRRNSMQLKRCWENIKTQRKKELSQELMEMTQTGGGPPQGGSATISDNVVDIICPFINLTVPGVIDSNTIEIPDIDDQKKIDLNKMKFDSEDSSLIVADVCKKKKPDTQLKSLAFTEDDVDENVPSQSKKVYKSTSTSYNRLSSEIVARVKRCLINTENDQALHEFRMKREKILIERENNLLNYEKEIHDLQKEKIKLEIELLKKKNLN